MRGYISAKHMSNRPFKSVTFYCIHLFLLLVSCVCYWKKKEKNPKKNLILFWPSIDKMGQFSSLLLINVQLIRIFCLFCGFFRDLSLILCDENDKGQNSIKSLFGVRCAQCDMCWPICCTKPIENVLFD